MTFLFFMKKWKSLSFGYLLFRLFFHVSSFSLSVLSHISLEKLLESSLETTVVTGTTSSVTTVGTLSLAGVVESLVHLETLGLLVTLRFSGGTKGELSDGRGFAWGESRKVDLPLNFSGVGFGRTPNVFLLRGDIEGSVLWSLGFNVDVLRF